MNHIHRRHVLWAGLLSTVPPIWAQARPADMGDIINRAGSLRMLSQRMSKAWLAVGQNIQPQNAPRVLQKSVAQFEQIHTELKPLLPTPAIRALHDQLSPIWNEFKTRLTATPPSQPVAANLLTLDGRVLAQAHKLTQALEVHTAQPISELVNLAGRQRMLSQFIAKCHLAMLWRSAPADLHTQVDAARDEFKRNLNRLKAAPQTTPTLAQDLTMAQQQWVFLESAVARDDRITAKDAAEVFSSSENLLELMDQITRQYVRLST